MAEEQAQDRTEQPTPRRLQKAREDGQVAYSQDLSSGLLLASGTIFFAFFGYFLLRGLSGGLKTGLTRIGTEQPDSISPESIFQNALLDGSRLVLPLAFVAFGILVLSGAAVTGFQLSGKPLSFNLDKLDPRKGIKRIFSSRSVVKGLIAVAKVSVMAVIAFILIQMSREKIAASYGIDVKQSMYLGWEIVIQIAMAISAAMVLIGLMDLLYQKWKHFQELRMSRQELKEELKEDVGDPHLKARLRQLQREYATGQMMADVPSASVVLTNPTHLAVAIRYDRLLDDAPVVLAKGADAVAKRIVSLARENDIPVLERKPLARALYRDVQVGQEIPVELYQAIAEILAYVQRQKSILRR